MGQFTIARSDGQVVALVVAGGIEPWQVVGVVAEVGIHLEDVAILTAERPFEARYIGGAQSQFARPLQDEESVAELGIDEAVHDSGRSIGASVVDNEYMETFLQGEDGPDYFLYVFLLIVGGYDNQTVALIHRHRCWFAVLSVLDMQM